jgi:hypothetical protein
MAPKTTPHWCTKDETNACKQLVNNLKFKSFLEISFCPSCVYGKQKTSQSYKLHGFIPNSCETYYFIGLYILNTNVMHYLNDFRV